MERDYINANICFQWYQRTDSIHVTAILELKLGLVGKVQM